MDDIRPQHLPAFLDPLLDHLADFLPPSLYNTLFTLLSYTVILISPILTTVSYWKPWEWQWDTQKLLPPLIVFLIAYYTLLNIYRTTTFMVRMTFRLLKWAAIFGMLGAAIGWLNFNNNNTSGSSGGFAGGGKGAASGRRRDGGADASLNQGQSARRSGSRSGGNTRPRAWDSFADHKQWQYNEQQRQAPRAQQGDSDGQQQHIIQQIADYAGRAMGGSAYDIISGAKSFLDKLAEASSADVEDGTTGGNHDRQPSTKNRKEKVSSQRKASSR